MRLTDRVALVTGGTRMGASLGQALASDGAHVAFSYWRSRDAARAAADAVTAAGRDAIAVGADLRKPADCQTLVDDVATWHGRLDVLVCLASVYRRTDLGGLTREEWHAQLAVDLDASFHCARAAADVMRTQGGGHIVLCSDWVAASGRPRYTGFLPYYVAKAGVVALTEALALELAPAGIQVNAIAPGPMLPAAAATAAMQDAILQATPLGRWGGPHALSHAVLGLLQQDWVTGQVIRVDGGRHLA